MTPKSQLDGFLDAYTPELRKHAQAILKAMRTLVPGARWLVYDNYNALVIAFSATERVSDIVLSVALYPRWVSMFFMHGTSLPDPTEMLTGSGKGIRHVVVDDLALLSRRPFRALLRAALERAEPPIDPHAKHAIVIKSISKKQRPRRPSGPTRTAAPRPRAGGRRGSTPSASR